MFSFNRSNGIIFINKIHGALDKNGKEQQKSDKGPNKLEKWSRICLNRLILTRNKKSRARKMYPAKYLRSKKTLKWKHAVILLKLQLESH